MTSLGLFFVGSVLLINGLTLLGVVEARSASPVNALVGALLVPVAMVQIVSVEEPITSAGLPVAMSAAGFLLFAFTYLLVAVVDWTGHSGVGLGWYCGWAAAVSLFLAIVNLVRLGDARFGVIWIAWTVLFVMFFVNLALERDSVSRATGWLTVLQSVTTASLPGALELLGLWPEVPVLLVLAVQVIPLAVLGYMLLSNRRTAARPHSTDLVGSRS